MKRILIALALAFGPMSAQPQPTNLIPAPAEYSVRPGIVSLDKLVGQGEKVRISPKALLRRLEGRKLAD